MNHEGVRNFAESSEKMLQLAAPCERDCYAFCGDRNPWLPENPTVDLRRLDVSREMFLRTHGQPSGQGRMESQSGLSMTVADND